MRRGLLLSALAGFVDAVGFLHFGGLFVSFMSGNTTRLGLEAAGGDVAAAVASVVALASFVLGAAAGAGLARVSARRSPLMLAEGALLALAALVAGAWHGGAALAVIAPLALAMGMQNLLRAPGEGGAQTGGTFVTGTMVAVGTSLADLLARRPGAGAALRGNAAVWGALLLGATLGGFAALGLALPALLAIPAVALAALGAAEALRGR